jgi:hypothetical protein
MTTRHHAPVRSRKSWHARQWKDFTTQSPPTQAFIHHGAETDREAKSVTNWTAMYAAMRETQNFHMDTRGWSDIAYHAVVFQKRGKMQHPNICLGRPSSHVPAAQLNHNTNTFAVCVFGTIDSSDPLQDETIHAIAWFLKQHPSLRSVGGHRDVTQTSCPGDMVYRQIGRIAALAGLKRF